MLVKDEAALKRDKLEKSGEQETEKVWNIQKTNTESLAKVLDDPDIRVLETNHSGVVLSEAEFEARLLRLNPNFRFFRGKLDNSKKYIGLETPGGLEYITCYPACFIPEHSLLRIVEEDVRDYTVGNPHLPGSPRIDAGAVREAAEKSRKSGAPVERTQAMGWKKIRRVDEEISRGWRTVLLQLLIRGVVSLTDVEREFPETPDKNWQEKVGRRQSTLPF